MLGPPRFGDVLAVAAFAVFLFLFGVEGRSLRRASEGRVARVAQEFIDTGDWIVPHLNGEPRVKKPPLSSWLVAGTTRILGRQRVAAFDALLPTGLAATLLLVFAYLWVSRSVAPVLDANEHSRAAGMMSALALVMMPAFIGQARSAEMDMLLGLFVFVGFWKWERWRSQGVVLDLLLFYAAMGLGFLTKGPVVFVIVVPALLVWEILNRRRTVDPDSDGKLSSRLWIHLAGAGIVLALVLPWGIPFLIRSGITWADFSTEFVERVGEKTGHKEAWYFYLANVPHWALPWVLLLPFVAIRDWRAPDSQATRRRRLWWCWFGVNLIIWSVLTAKQRHYAVPWLPPLALLIGEGMVDMVRDATKSNPDGVAIWGRRAAVSVSVLLGIAILTGSAFLPVTDALSTNAKWILAFVAGASFAWGAWALASGSGRGPFVSWWIGAAGALAIYAGTLEAHVDRTRSPQAFCDLVRRHVPDSARLHDIGVAYRRPQVLFYLGRNVIPLAEKRVLKGDEKLAKAEREKRHLERQVQAVEEILASDSAYVLVNTRVRDQLATDTHAEPFPAVSSFLGHDRTVHLLTSPGPDE